MVQQKDNSRMILAIVLVAAGLIALFRRAPQLPFFFNFHLIPFHLPLGNMFTYIGNILFSWQMVLIITGIILIAGKRSAGLILIVLGGIFILPDILHISFWSLSFLIPAVLIGAGIVLILKGSVKINQ